MDRTYKGGNWLMLPYTKVHLIPESSIFYRQRSERRGNILSFLLKHVKSTPNILIYNYDKRNLWNDFPTTGENVTLYINVIYNLFDPSTPLLWFRYAVQPFFDRNLRLGLKTIMDCPLLTSSVCQIASATSASHFYSTF